jgi:hypothetical protein
MAIWPFDQAGGADTDRFNVRVPHQQLVDDVMQGGQCGAFVFGRGGNRRDAFNDLAVAGDHTAGDFGAADVKADGLPGSRVIRVVGKGGGPGHRRCSCSVVRMRGGC